jgi:UDP-N-acetylglucosamine--N-acetylmuramyl-(pentapeptide) pyrophosphoryl-undecaprenol N-acetylglucosamine transferase
MEEVHRQSELSGETVECHYVGEAKDGELLRARTRIPFPIHVITAGKLNRHLTWRHMVQAARGARGWVQAERLLTKLQPDLVFAKGGYVCVPVVLAASRRKIPIFGHETDLVPGLTNRLVARYARRVFTAFPTRHYQFSREKLCYVGQPVWGAFRNINAEVDLVIQGELPGDQRPLITVMGGSQGARAINRAVAALWPRILERTDLLHLSGSRDYVHLVEEAAGLPQPLRRHLFLLPHLHEPLPLALAHSQLVVSRAGGTLFELAALRKPSILIPLPSAAQDHQRANATVLEDAGAAVILEEKNLTPDVLYACLTELLDDGDRRERLSQAIASFDRPDAAADMARELLQALPAYEPT